ncbi:TOR1A [Bugula neritina]|uniref:TOR1A n=1 Tax=Bugula neritina TaxID=10212 RepID=A0A7J7J2R7_BUGNE|nr:TOR1A [Bugula neritina]
MSFQGGTGTGKTFAAQTIVKNLYKEQEKSKYVHWFKATELFTREDKVKDYQDQIRDWIKGNLTLCPYQLFILDEVEKMPEGVLDVLKPFVDFTFPEEDVEYRKAIYILLG